MYAFSGENDCGLCKATFVSLLLLGSLRRRGTTRASCGPLCQNSGTHRVYVNASAGASWASWAVGCGVGNFHMQISWFSLKGQMLKCEAIIDSELRPLTLGSSQRRAGSSFHWALSKRECSPPPKQKDSFSKLW